VVAYVRAAGATGSRPNDEYALVPPGAVGLPVPAKGYILEEIRDGVYWVSNGGHLMSVRNWWRIS
jgi:hypothetical protein